MTTKYADKIAIGAAWPGFDDSRASWGLNRHMDARSGKTFEETLGFYRRYYSDSNPLPFLLIETWNDYEEGQPLSAHPLPTAATRRDGVAAYPDGATRNLTVLSWLLFGCRNGQDQSRLDVPSGILIFIAKECLICWRSPMRIIWVIRGLQPLEQMASAVGNCELADWAAQALRKEQARISDAISFLSEICDTLQAEGLNTMVIKSLDHWPDLGSDLDLFTSAPATDVIQVMKSHFSASLAARSWGDRLANKWNFIVPGLRELVEVHVGRLGQTGEHVTLAKSLIRRGRSLPFEGYSFRGALPRTPTSSLAPCSGCIAIFLFSPFAMYRTPPNWWRKIRGLLSFLRSLTRTAGIWEGAATFLTVVSDYLEHFRGNALSLPPFVLSAARFRGNQLTFQRFLRIPIMPHSVRLYTSQLRQLALNGEVEGTLRLSLLPCLATAAVVEQRVTGSDKGMW